MRLVKSPIFLAPFLALTLACNLAGGDDGTTAGKIIAPPGGGVYLGAYNWEGDGLAVFERVIGRRVAIGMPYATDCGGSENTWPYFTSTGYEEAWQEGYVWQTGIETALGQPNPKFIPQDVIDGAIDTYLVEMAEDIADWGRPIFWMYPREPCIQPGPGYDGGGYGPDGDLTKSEAQESGYSLDGEYGDPDELDGPERYRDMCRHIHDVMAPLAPNITWVMGAIVARFEGAYIQWYPGDAYVDWHALDVYAGGEEDEGSNDPFADIIEPAWSEALSLAPDKPFMIVEFGASDAYLGDRSAWFNDFFQAAKTTHTELGAFIYWQSEEMMDTRIDPDDPCADDWYNEMNGPDAAWWLSSVETE